MGFGPEQLRELGMPLRPDLCIAGRQSQLQAEIADVPMLALRNLLPKRVSPVLLGPAILLPIVVAGAADHVVRIVPAAPPLRSPELKRSHRHTQLLRLLPQTLAGLHGELRGGDGLVGRQLGKVIATVKFVRQSLRVGFHAISNLFWFNALNLCRETAITVAPCDAPLCPALDGIVRQLRLSRRGVPRSGSTKCY